MSNAVNFDPAERQHPAELRIQYVLRLLDYFLPLMHQVEFCAKVWSLICFGYRSRNPLRKESPDAFSRTMQQISDRRVAPSSMSSAIAEMLGGLLLGTPGTGKTTSVTALLSRLGPGLLHHKIHGELYQLLYLKVEAPKNGSEKAIAQEIFTKLRAAALETGLPMPYRTGKMPKSVAELTAAINELASKLNLGILVLDELQHLYRGKDGHDNEAMKFLTSVINRLGIPILLIGTWECYGLLGLEVRIARRATGAADAQFRRMQNDEEWPMFLDALFSHQFTRKPVELTPEISEKFYFHTQGIQDLAVKLLVMSQIDAILDETEELTASSIEASANRHLNLMANILRMLRSGRRDDDPTLWDLEPADLNGYIKEFSAKANTRLRRRIDRATFNAAKRAGVVDAVASSLIATGEVGNDEAVTLATAAARDAPDATASNLLATVLKESDANVPRPTKAKSSKRQKEVADAILALKDEDLRKVLFLATREEVSADVVAIAYSDAGHLCELVEDMP